LLPSQVTFGGDNFYLTEKPLKYVRVTNKMKAVRTKSIFYFRII
jgi:hypothetical protein